MSIYEISNKFFKKNADRRNIRPPQSSWKLVDWIIMHSILEKNDKLVAATIASHYNSKLGYAFPSYKRISASTGLSNPTIQRAIHKMKETGEWIVIPFFNEESGAKTNNWYIPLAPKQDDTKDPKRSHIWQSSWPQEWVNLAPANSKSSYDEWVRINRNKWV